MLCIYATWLCTRGSGRPGQEGGGQLPPLKFGIYLLCLNKFSYHLHAGPFLLYIALTISTISRGAVKINVSCDMLKLLMFDLDPAPPVEKWFLRARWPQRNEYDHRTTSGSKRSGDGDVDSTEQSWRWGQVAPPMYVPAGAIRLKNSTQNNKTRDWSRNLRKGVDPSPSLPLSLSSPPSSRPLKSRDP